MNTEIATRPITSQIAPRDTRNISHSPYNIYNLWTRRRRTVALSTVGFPFAKEIIKIDMSNRQRPFFGWVFGQWCEIDKENYMKFASEVVFYTPDSFPVDVVRWSGIRRHRNLWKLNCKCPLTVMKLWVFFVQQSGQIIIQEIMVQFVQVIHVVNDVMGNRNSSLYCHVNFELFVKIIFYIIFIYYNIIGLMKLRNYKRFCLI